MYIILFIDNLNIVTHCIAVTKEIETALSHFNLNQTLTIQNIESFYNYRTVDNDYKLVTSVLSSENSFITLKIKSQKTLHKNFQVIPEEINETEIVNLGHLHNKKSRINSALAKIRVEKAKTSDTETPFYNYFSLVDSISNESNSNENIERVLPDHCRPVASNGSKSKKTPCINCSKLCSYTIEMILHPTKSISQDDIIEELEIHGHPTSRKYEDENGNKRNRTKYEAARELANHFIFAHNKTEPEFL